MLRTVGVAVEASILESTVLSGGFASSLDDREVRQQRDGTLNRERYTLLAATNYETEVYTIEAENLPSTVFVFDGIRGNERAASRPYIS